LPCQLQELGKFTSALNNNFAEEHFHPSDTPLSIAVRDLPIFGKGTMLQIVETLLLSNANPNDYYPPSVRV